MILSRQTIREYLEGSESDFEVYKEIGDYKENIEEKQIQEHSIELRLGYEIIEQPLFRIKDKPYEIEEILRGVNPEKERNDIEKNSRTLNLSNLEDYDLIEVSDRVYRPKKDDYVYSTLLTERDGELGIMLHPEVNNTNLKVTKIREMIDNILKFNRGMLDAISEEDEERYRQILRNQQSYLEIMEEQFRGNIGSSEDYYVPSAKIIYSLEHIKVPRDIRGRLDSRSSLARLFLPQHASSARINAGFDNKIAFEVENRGNLPVVLFPEDAVAEVEFSFLDKPTELSYDEKEGSRHNEGLGF